MYVSILWKISYIAEAWCDILLMPIHQWFRDRLGRPLFHEPVRAPPYYPQVYIYTINKYRGGLIILVHYNDVIMSAMASQITASRLFIQPFIQAQMKEKIKLRVTGRSPVNSPHKGPVTRKMFPFDDVIMKIWIVRLVWKGSHSRLLNLDCAFNPTPASEHRWLVKAPGWIHSVPDVSDRRLWRCGCHARLWNLQDVTNTSCL